MKIAAPIAAVLLLSGPALQVAHAQDAAPGGGQAAPPAAPPTAPGTTPGAPASGGAATTSPTYKIAEEDILDVQVLDHPEVNKSYQVPAEGVLDIPYVGELNVIGMTLHDLKDRLTKSFGKQFYNPYVILSAHPAQMLVDVIGVAKNGKYPLKHNEHILEVIASAGGLPVDRPENYKATLIRNKTGEAIAIDIAKLYNNVASENLIVEKDDTLYVEEKPVSNTTIQVIGQVGHPGPLVVPRDGSILAVLQASGGPTAAAALSKSFIKRGDQIIPIDLRDYQKTGFISSTSLQAGDELIVPENKNEYYVYGAGGQPGVHIYPDDKKLTVYSALAMNGGSTEGVDLTKVVLLHPVSGSTSQRSVVNVERMLKTGDYSGDLPVSPGDTIQVPPSKARRGLGFNEVLSILGSLGGLVGLYSLFKH